MKQTVIYEWSFTSSQIYFYLVFDKRAARLKRMRVGKSIKRQREIIFYRYSQSASNANEYKGGYLIMFNPVMSIVQSNKQYPRKKCKKCMSSNLFCLSTSAQHIEHNFFCISNSSLKRTQVLNSYLIFHVDKQYKTFYILCPYFCILFIR